MNRIFSALILAAGILGLATHLTAQTAAKPEADPKQKLQKFFSLLQSNSIDAAYDYILEGSGIKDKPQAVAMLKSQTKAQLPLLGSPIGHEQIKYEQLSDSLIHIISLYKTNAIPTYWEFYFYRAKADWVLVKLDFRDDPNLILK